MTAFAVCNEIKIFMHLWLSSRNERTHDGLEIGPGGNPYACMYYIKKNLLNGFSLDRPEIF